MACLSTKTEFTCLLVAVNDASSFTYVQPLWPKSDALQVLKEQIHYAEIQTSRKLKSLCKWVSTAATSWQNKAGFRWQKTSAYTSKQTGKAEHTIRMIREMNDCHDAPTLPAANILAFCCQSQIFHKKSSCQTSTTGYLTISSLVKICGAIWSAQDLWMPHMG